MLCSSPVKIQWALDHSVFQASVGRFGLLTQAVGGTDELYAAGVSWSVARPGSLWCGWPLHSVGLVSFPPMALMCNTIIELWGLDSIPLLIKQPMVAE